MKKHLSVFYYRTQNLQASFSISFHDAFENADLRSVKRVSRSSVARETFCGSVVKKSQCRFRRSESPIVIKSQNFFLISRLWQGEKKIFLHGRLYVDLSSKICLCFPLQGYVFMSRNPGNWARFLSKLTLTLSFVQRVQILS